MPDIGTLRAVVTADDSQFAAGLQRAETRVQSFGSSFDQLRTAALGIGAAFTAATAAITVASNEIIQLADRVSGEASLARAFGLAREEYVRLGLALEATGQARDELRDLIGDTQEILGLLSRGETRETQLFAELGLDASFAARGVNDLDGAMLELFDRVNALDRVAARGLLTQLVGADASRRILEAASAVDVIRQQLDQPLILASEESRVELEAFAQTLRVGREQVAEFAIIGVGALSAAIQAIPEGALILLGAPVQAAFSAFQDRLSSTAEALRNLETATEGAAQATAGTAIPQGIQQLPSMQDLAGQDLARTIELQLEVIGPALERAFGPFIDDVVPVIGQANREFELSTGQAFLLGSTINTVLGAAIDGVEDWGDVILSVLAQLTNFGLGNLAGGLGFFGGARQFGGPVSPGQAYLVGERGPELFVPSSAGRVEPNDVIAANNFDVTFNISGAGDPQAVAQQVVQGMQQLMQRPGSTVNVAARTAYRG